MDDMNAFDRQLASVVIRRVGPSEPVDDLAIYEAVTAASRSHGWGFTMFSALKFIAASVIVALFGGFLATGVFTMQQGDEVLPAAVAESPSAAATGSPSAAATGSPLRITFKPTGDPDVFEVISEPQQSWLHAHNVGPIAIDPDGGVWVQGWRGRRAFLVELGVPGRVKLEPFEAEDLAFTPDGTLWAPMPRREPRNPRQAQPVLRSFDGEVWTRHDTSGSTVFSEDCAGPAKCDAVVDLSRAADGTVHGLQGIGGKADVKEDADLATDVLSQIVVSIADEEGLVERYLDWPPGRMWAGTCVGDGGSTASGIPQAVAATPDGDIWVGGRCGLGWGVFANGTEGWLLRYRDGTPEVVRPLGADVDPGVSDIAVGPEGEVWVLMHAGTDRYLGQFDGSEWALYASADGLDLGGDLAVGPDGRVWYAAFDETAGESGSHAGLAVFNGQTIGRYLEDAGISDIAIADDGSVWVTANAIGGDDGPSGIFVIRPEGAVPE